MLQAVVRLTKRCKANNGTVCSYQAIQLIQKSKLFVMPESGQNQNFYNIVVDFVDQSVLVCDPSGINCSVITFERFNLSGACFWMGLQFIKQFDKFWKCLWRFLLEKLQVFLGIR